MADPLSSLALWPVGNCQVSALVDGEAGFVWGCVPRVDGDPIFCALLGGDKQHQGVWRFRLAGQVKATPRYRRNTPILVTHSFVNSASRIAARSDFTCDGVKVRCGASWSKVRSGPG